MKRISLLGSTGSIGESTLRVVADHPDRFQVVALAAGAGRLERLAEQVRDTGARLVSVPRPIDAAFLSTRVSHGVDVVWGAEGLLRVATGPEPDQVVSAIVGAAGLPPTYAALVAGVDVALANKESLVAGGEVVMAAARASGAVIVPVDSEHSAVYQALEGQRTEAVRRLVLTASGGPFRGFDRRRLARVGVDEALEHPNWSMGPKITVDSATLMNKGLEVIEARWLFDVEPDRIDVTLHPQSVVHSMVEFTDGSILAQMGVPDMRGPIAYALGYPERLPMPELRLDLWGLGALTFEPPDRDAFPCLDLAYHALGMGGTAPAVLSAANEVAVEAFLGRRLGFTAIPEVVEATLAAHPGRKLDHVKTALEADRWARARAREVVCRRAEGGRAG